jgi:hypothetical protein
MRPAVVGLAADGNRDHAAPAAGREDRMSLHGRLKKLEGLDAGAGPCPVCAAGILFVEEVVVTEWDPTAAGQAPSRAPERCPACGGPWWTKEIRDAPLGGA